jgi:hypothetical protein
MKSKNILEEQQLFKPNAILFKVMIRDCYLGQDIVHGKAWAKPT